MIESETLNEVENMENIILVAQDMKEKIPDSWNTDSFIKQILSASNIKPLSTFGVNETNKNLQIEVANRLGLVYEIKSPNDQGFSEMIVSKYQKTIDEYNRIDNAEIPWQEKTRQLGKIFGFKNKAINEFIAETEQTKQKHKLFEDFQKGKYINDELFLVWQTADMIPAGTDDQEAMQMGAEIKKVLDKINPKITREYIERGKLEIAK